MKISLIVPMYNVEAFLPRCVESIINQTYQDLEIILVNDGSPDRCLEIAQEFAGQDKRVVVISQMNGGLSAARNTGLKAATGDYVMFVDSDDWIDLNMVEVLWKSAVKNCADLSCCRIRFENPVVGRSFDSRNCYEREVISGKEILIDALLVRTIPTSVLAKLYRRNFLIDNELWFKEGVVNEDTLFTVQVAVIARRISFTNDSFYHALEREGSISRSSQERLFRDMITVLECIRNLFITKGIYDQVEIYFKARYLKSLLYNILQIAQRLDYKEYRRIFSICMNESFYREYNKNIIRKVLPCRHRLVLAVSCFPMGCYLLMKGLNCVGIRMH